MIYLDHNATTPLAPEALAAMEPFLTSEFGNPSSVHRYGRVARSALDTAREQVAALVGAHPAQVLFTSGGTEANTLALYGAAGKQAPRLLSPTEHAALRDPALRMAREGYRVDWLRVDSQGRVDPSSVEDGLRAGSGGLLSVMWANNETGVIQDLPAIASQARAAGWRVHTDAVQAVGKLPVNFEIVDLMSLSAHKIRGPKGVGALILRREVELASRQVGGGQERGLRGGTENLPGIVGFGVAAELARQRLEARTRHCRDLRDALERELAELGRVVFFSREAERVGNTSQFAVPGFESEALLMALDRAGVAVSSGSACHAGSGEPSHVLLAMAVDPDLARCAIRVSFGEDNGHDDVAAFVTALRKITGSVPASMLASVGGGA